MEANTETELGNWMRSGKYLPLILRDFHDQKDFFKFIAGKVEGRRKQEVENGSYSTYTYEGFDWVKFHVWVIDFFLWFMAMNGYTLQKSRQRLPFRDYDETIKKSRQELMEQFAADLAQDRKSK